MSKKHITTDMYVAANHGRDLLAETANQDLIKVLNGQPTSAEEAKNTRLVEALQGGPSTDDNALIGLLNGKSQTLQLNEAGDRTPNLWIADLALEAADSALGTAIMRKHPGIVPTTLAKQARTILQECYDEAGKIAGDEAERRQVAADKANQIAAEMNRPAAPAAGTMARESKKAAKSMDPITEAKQPATGDSPIVVIYESLDGKELSRRRMTAAEADKLAAQPNGELVIEQAKRIHEVTKGIVTP